MPASAIPRSARCAPLSRFRSSRASIAEPKTESPALPAISIGRTVPLFTLRVARLRRFAFLAELFQQCLHVLGVLLFLGEDLFQHAAGGRVVVAEVLDDFAIAVDRDALGDQVLLDHVDEIIALDVIGMRPR